MNIVLPNYVLVGAVVCLAVWTTAGVWLCQLIRDERKRRERHEQRYCVPSQVKHKFKPRRREGDEWKDQA